MPTSTASPVTLPTTGQTPVSSRVTINGQQLAVYSWSVNINSYGSVGSFEIRTSLEYLRQSNIDIYGDSLKSAGPLAVQIFVSDQYGNTDLLIFGGEYDRSEWSFLNDEVVLTGRDWAGILVDSKVTLQDQQMYMSTATANDLTVTTGVTSSYQINDVTITQLFNQICKNYGFTPNIVQPANIVTTPLGTLLNDFQAYTTSPKSIWEILLFLARAASTTGQPYQVFVSPDKTLNLAPAATVAPVKFSWNRGLDWYKQVVHNQPGAPTEFPLMDLHVTHNPRRNSTFGVVVLSYHFASVTQQQYNLIYVNNDNYDANAATWQGFGVHGPGFAKGVNPYGASSLLGSQGRPIFVFREHQALDVNQVQALAFEKALQIAKREIIIEGVIDGYALLKPMQPFFIDGAAADLLGFNVDGAGPRSFYVTHVQHEFNLPQGATTSNSEGAGAGFVTRFTGWTIPPTFDVSTSAEQAEEA